MLRIISKALLIVLLSYPIMAAVLAGDYYQPSEEAMAPAMETCTAKAAASGQHQYKATERPQWSAALSRDGCSTAASVGFGIQAGKVFITGNVSDNVFSSIESDPMISISGSGTF